MDRYGVICDSQEKDYGRPKWRRRPLDCVRSVFNVDQFVEELVVDGQHKVSRTWRTLALVSRWSGAAVKVFCATNPVTGRRDWKMWIVFLTVFASSLLCLDRIAVWSSYNPVTSSSVFSITLYTLLVLFFILAILWILCVAITPLLDDDCINPMYDDDEPTPSTPQPLCEPDKLIGRTCLAVFQALLIVGVARIVSLLYMLPFAISNNTVVNLPLLLLFYVVFSVCLIGPVITLIQSMLCCCIRPYSSTVPALCCFSKLIDI